MTKNYISQSCLSVLTSVEIISQICLFVGLCVCLFLCVFHHFLRNDWIFFSKTLSIDFWGIAEVVTTIKKIHTCWLFLLIFVGYFTLLFFLRTLYNFLLKFYRNVLGITLMVTTLKNIFVQSVPFCWGSFCGILWPIWGIILEIYSIIFMKFCTNVLGTTLTIITLKNVS